MYLNTGGQKEPAGQYLLLFKCFRSKSSDGIDVFDNIPYIASENIRKLNLTLIPSYEDIAMLTQCSAVESAESA